MDERIGVVIGRGKETDQLEIVVAFQERERSPKLGEFLVVEETEFMRRKLLARVEEFSYGDFQATKDERIRALVEKYVREITGVGRELSEEEKKALFFRHYILKVLGEIKLEDARIKTDYRVLPELTSLCRYPTEQELKVITSAGLEGAEHTIHVGHLSMGEEVRKTDVIFDLDKFKDKRTAIFARTGYGKSNLCKLVVSLASLTGVGLLIFDMEGEYTFGDPSKNIIGLTDIPGIKENLVVYTNRRDYDLSLYSSVWIRPPINLQVLRPWQIASLLPQAGNDERAAIANFRARREVPNSLIELAEFYADRSTIQNNEQTLWDDLYRELGAAESQKPVLRRNFSQILPLNNPNAPNIVTDSIWHIARGRTVVVDLSLLPHEVAIPLSSIILEGIFRYNIRNITQGKLVECIAVFEEAQDVLNRDAVKEGRSYFARWAKEGRKYHLGLIYVTQQPGAIAEEIVSQTDNFFIMHLLGKGDIDALRRANPHYNGVISDFLKNETIIGNAYIYSAPKQPYTFPCRVLEFNKSNIEDLLSKSKVSEQKSVVQEMQELSGLISLTGDDENKVIGRFSSEVYNYFDKQGIGLPFADPNKKWIEWEYVHGLYKQLSSRKGE